MSRRDENPDCKLYVGGLEKDTSEQALEDAFSPFGRISNVWVSRDRPGFGFVTFEYPDEADEALRKLNGQTVAGCRLKVEVAGAGRSRPPRGGFRGGRGGDSFGGGRRGFGGGRGGFREGRDGFGSRGGGGGCYNCGQSGHFARDCPQSESGGRSRPSNGYGSRDGRDGGYSNGSRRSDDRHRSRSPAFR